MFGNPAVIRPFRQFIGDKMILWSRVEELREEVGEEDFSEVAEMFLDEVEEALTRLAQGATDPGEELHFVKGSALNLGFRGLALACATAETSDLTALDHDDLAAIFDSSKIMFLERIAPTA